MRLGGYFESWMIFFAAWIWLQWLVRRRPEWTWARQIPNGIAVLWGLAVLIGASSTEDSTAAYANGLWASRLVTLAALGVALLLNARHLTTERAPTGPKR